MYHRVLKLDNMMVIDIATKARMIDSFFVAHAQYTSKMRATSITVII